MIKVKELQEQAAGPVVLLVDRINADKVACPAGTQISPKVPGWPEHRVVHALQHGHAAVGVMEKKEVLTPAKQPKDAYKEPSGKK